MTNKHSKLNYLTEQEAKMPLDLALLQITLGLQTCKTKGEVVELLHDAVELGIRAANRRESSNPVFDNKDNVFQQERLRKSQERLTAAKGGKAANAERQVTDVGMVCRPEHKPPRKSLKPIGKVGLELLRGERR